eukprot:894724_1
MQVEVDKQPEEKSESAGHSSEENPSETNAAVCVVSRQKEEESSQDVTASDDRDEIKGGSSFCQQFLAVLTKNWIMKKRRPCATLCEIILPVLLIALLGLLSTASEPNLSTESLQTGFRQPFDISTNEDQLIQEMKDSDSVLAILPVDSKNELQSQELASLLLISRRTTASFRKQLSRVKLICWTILPDLTTELPRNSPFMQL